MPPKKNKVQKRGKRKGGGSYDGEYVPPPYAVSYDPYKKRKKETLVDYERGDGEDDSDSDNELEKEIEESYSEDNDGPYPMKQKSNIKKAARSEYASIQKSCRVSIRIMGVTAGDFEEQKVSEQWASQVITTKQHPQTAAGTPKSRHSSANVAPAIGETVQDHVEEQRDVASPQNGDRDDDRMDLAPHQEQFMMLEEPEEPVANGVLAPAQDREDIGNAVGREGRLNGGEQVLFDEFDFVLQSPRVAQELTANLTQQPLAIVESPTPRLPMEMDLSMDGRGEREMDWDQHAQMNGEIQTTAGLPKSRRLSDNVARTIGGAAENHPEEQRDVASPQNRVDDIGAQMDLAPPQGQFMELEEPEEPIANALSAPAQDGGYPGNADGREEGREGGGNRALLNEIAFPPQSQRIVPQIMLNSTQHPAAIVGSQSQPNQIEVDRRDRAQDNREPQPTHKIVYQIPSRCGSAPAEFERESEYERIGGQRRIGAPNGIEGLDRSDDEGVLGEPQLAGAEGPVQEPIVEELANDDIAGMFDDDEGPEYCQEEWYAKIGQQAMLEKEKSSGDRPQEITQEDSSSVSISSPTQQPGAEGEQPKDNEASSGDGSPAQTLEDSSPISTPRLTQQLQFYRPWETKSVESQSSSTSSFETVNWYQEVVAPVVQRPVPILPPIRQVPVEIPFPVSMSPIPIPAPMDRPASAFVYVGKAATPMPSAHLTAPAVPLGQLPAPTMSPPKPAPAPKRRQRAPKRVVPTQPLSLNQLPTMIPHPQHHIPTQHLPTQHLPAHYLQQLLQQQLMAQQLSPPFWTPNPLPPQTPSQPMPLMNPNPTQPITPMNLAPPTPTPWNQVGPMPPMGPPMGPMGPMGPIGPMNWLPNPHPMKNSGYPFRQQ